MSLTQRLAPSFLPRPVHGFVALCGLLRDRGSKHTVDVAVRTVEQSAPSPTLTVINYLTYEFADRRDNSTVLQRIHMKSSKFK